MLLTRQDSVYVFVCPYDSREIPKDAGFAWDGDKYRWWTDHFEVARRLAEHADTAALAAIAEADKTPASLLAPEGKVRGAHIVDVRIRKEAAGAFRDIVEVHYPVKNEALLEAVKDIGFRWCDTRCWKRLLRPSAGDVRDRAAEVASDLLDLGFRVRVHDPETQRRAVDGDWKPEQTRWIGFADSDEAERPLTFRLSWRKSDDLYDAAKSLPGSRYMGSGVVCVPHDAAEAVADFAVRYGFALTPVAQEAVDAFRDQVLGAIVVKRKPKAAAPTKAPGNRPARLPAPVAEEGIDASLLDD